MGCILDYTESDDNPLSVSQLKRGTNQMLAQTWTRVYNIAPAFIPHWHIMGCYLKCLYSGFCVQTSQQAEPSNNCLFQRWRKRCYQRWYITTKHETFRHGVGMLSDKRCRQWTNIMSTSSDQCLVLDGWYIWYGKVNAKTITLYIYIKFLVNALKG